LLSAALSSVETDFVDGAVVAAARALPTWSDGDVPAIPNVERKSAQALQEECRQMLDSFSTTIEQDQQILGKVLYFMVFHRTVCFVRAPCTETDFDVCSRFRCAYQQNPRNCDQVGGLPFFYDC